MLCLHGQAHRDWEVQYFLLLSVEMLNLVIYWHQHLTQCSSSEVCHESMCLHTQAHKKQVCVYHESRLAQSLHPQNSTDFHRIGTPIIHEVLRVSAPCMCFSCGWNRCQICELFRSKYHNVYRDLSWYHIFSKLLLLKLFFASIDLFSVFLLHFRQSSHCVWGHSPFSMHRRPNTSRSLPL